MRHLRQHLYPLLLSLAVAGTSIGGDPGPSPVDVLKASTSSIHRFVLDNGMICLVKEDHSAPVVAIQVWVGTGAIHEEDHLGAGLSHALEHMIFKGTPTRPTGEITKDINEAGGAINAYTSFERTVFHTVIPSARWLVGLDVLSDAVRNASFPEDEWAREKDVILREMAMGRDSPERELNKLLWRTSYTAHPYRHPVIGYEEIFSKVTREDVAGFFNKHYVPDNMIVAVAGDIDPQEAETRLRNAFENFERRARAPVVLPKEPNQLAPRFAHQKGSYKISRLGWSYHTTDLTHPDTPALDVLAAIVGRGRSSRLVRELKERKQLVYSIDAWSYTPKHPGLFGITANFDPAKEEEVIRAIEDEIALWVSSPFTKEEVEKAKRMVLVDQLSQLETASGQAGDLASGEFYAADPAFGQRYLSMVNAVTPEDVSDVAKRYLLSERRSLVILSPETADAKAVRKEPAGAGAASAQKSMLANGIRIILREDHRLPFVYFCVALRGGLLSETEENNGITRLMAELLTRGTESRSAEKIAALVESLGGSLSAFSGANSFGIQGRCLSEDTDTFAGLLADCLLHPSFPKEEIAKQRDIQLAALRQQRERPFYLAREALRAQIFPGHPYRWDTLGSKDTLSAIDRDAIVAHFAKHARAGNVVLSLFGDITADEAQALGARHLASLATGNVSEPSRVSAKPDLPKRVSKREPKEQAILLVGYPGVSVDDPHADAMRVLQEAFSGLSSDLGTEVREKRGLVYYVGAFQQFGVDPGMFVFYAGTREDAVADVEALIGQEANRAATGGLREDELNRVKEQMVGEHHMQMQSNGSVALDCALNELYGLGYDHIFRTEDRIRGLTLEQIKEAARAILRPSRQAVSIILPQVPTTEKEKP